MSDLGDFKRLVYEPETKALREKIRVLEEKLKSHNKDYAGNKRMYQCPYNKACTCVMTEPCLGCEEHARYFA